jgi:hypothetical protein
MDCEILAGVTLRSLLGVRPPVLIHKAAEKLHADLQTAPVAEWDEIPAVVSAEPSSEPYHRSDVGLGLGQGGEFTERDRLDR